MSEARLYTYYKSQILPKMMEEFQYSSPMAVPRLEKVVINAGVGEAVADRKRLNDVVENIAKITGQKPVLTTARKSISNFKLREGMPIGCKVTLRKSMMYEFVDRFINLALPRSRDFQGIPDNNFDGRGNYNLGLKEHTIFIEIDSDNVSSIHGMDIAFVTTAKTDEEAFALLKHFGFPFKKRNN
jgi:large subunit ribosomal protein L5